MSQASAIQTTPNFDHVEHSNVVEHDKRISHERKGGKGLDEFSFRDAILWPVDEDEIGLVKQLAIARDRPRLGDVRDLLSDPAAGEIFFREPGLLKFARQDTMSKVVTEPSTGSASAIARVPMPVEVPISTTLRAPQLGDPNSASSL